MKNKKIKKGSRLIAEFMGWNYFEKSNYSKSWELLMLACKRWDNLDLLDNQEYVDNCNRLDHYVTLYSKKKVFKQLVKNIYWLINKNYRDLKQEQTERYIKFC